MDSWMGSVAESSLSDSGCRWNSNFLPVNGSEVRFASSKDEDPVAMIWMSLIASTANFKVIPISLTLCASSMTTRRASPKSFFNSVVVRAYNDCLISSSSQLRYMDLLLKRERSSFTKVVFPTCRAPYRIKTLPSKKRSSKAESKIRAIIFP